MTIEYARGYLDGHTKGQVYDPPWYYTSRQKQEYMKGYRDARDGR